jgi:hypothetical protein
MEIMRALAHRADDLGEKVQPMLAEETRAPILAVEGRE